jgi:hypothetical protein
VASRFAVGAAHHEISWGTEPESELRSVVQFEDNGFAGATFIEFDGVSLNRSFDFFRTTGGEKSREKKEEGAHHFAG